MRSTCLASIGSFGVFAVGAMADNASESSFELVDEPRMGTSRAAIAVVSAAGFGLAALWLSRREGMCSEALQTKANASKPADPGIVEKKVEDPKNTSSPFQMLWLGSNSSRPIEAVLSRLSQLGHPLGSDSALDKKEQVVTGYHACACGFAVGLLTAGCFKRGAVVLRSFRFGVNQRLAGTECNMVERLVQAKAQEMLQRNSFLDFANLFGHLPHLDPFLNGRSGSSKILQQIRGLMEQRQRRMDSDVECAHAGSSKIFFEKVHLLASMEAALSKEIPRFVHVMGKWEDRTQKACDKLEQNVRVALEDGHGEVEHALASLYSYAEDSLTFGPACLSTITMDTLESALDKVLQHSESQLQRLHSHLDRYQFEAASQCMQKLQALHVFFEGGFADQVARLEQRSGLPSEKVQQIKEMLANASHKLGEKVEGMVEARATDLLGRNSFDQFAELIGQLPHLESILHGRGGSSKLCAKLCGWVEQRHKQLESAAAHVECADGAVYHVGSSESFFQTLQLLASMETALSEHMPELVNVMEKWEDQTQKICHKLEQNVRIALEDGDGKVEHAFACLYSYAEDSLTFGPACLSKITMGTVESAFDKLLQHSESQLDQLHSHLDCCQLEAASKCLQQLQTLQEQVARLEQRSGLPLEKVQQIKEVLANVRPESVQKLGETAEGRVEARATELLGRNLFDKFAELICQLPHLGMFLHGRDNPSKLRSKLRELVVKTHSQAHKKIEQCWDTDDDEQLFQHLSQLASISKSKIIVDLDVELRSVTRDWKRKLKDKMDDHGSVAEERLKSWAEGTARQTIVVELTRELINLARMHLLLHHEAFREVAADARKLLVALLDMCAGCPQGHTLIRELDKALQPEMLHSRDARYGSWLAQTFGHFRDWRTLHFNQVMKKSPEDILKQWELPDAEKSELKAGVFSCQNDSGSSVAMISNTFSILLCIRISCVRGDREKHLESLGPGARFFS